jgi:hypothetical protein
VKTKGRILAGMDVTA